VIDVTIKENSVSLVTPPVETFNGRPATTAPPTAAAPRRRLGTGWLVAIVVALIVLPTAGAAALSAAEDPTYAAQVDVLYQQTATANAQSMERELATQQVLMQSRPLIDRAAATADVSGRELADAVTVEVVEESNVLRLQVADHDANRARVAAQAIGDEYIAAVREQAATSGGAAQERDLLTAQVQDLTAQLADKVAQVAQLTGVSNPSAAAQSQQRALEAEAQLIRQRLSEVQKQALAAQLQVVQEETGRAQVLAAPSLLDEPIAPQPLRAAAGGALLGLVLAAALVALLRVRHQPRRPAGS
jgi:uncharacterized protein involved in exopolysaccharide biosynthesis